MPLGKQLSQTATIKMKVFFIKLFLYPISILPMPVLYFMAKGFRFLFQYVLKYRVDVVTQNIELAFPENTTVENQKIIDGFYKYLSEILVEVIKGFTMSEANATKRFQILNPEVVEKYYTQNRNTILLIGHFNNWEWPGLGSRRQISHSPGAIFKPLKDKALNQWIVDNRGRYGDVMIPMKETEQYYANPQERLTFTAFIADQSPRTTDNALWVDFMGIKTASVRGPAIYAHKYNMPLIFADIQRVKQGYYTANFTLVSDEPNKMTEQEIMQRYAELLEAQIRKNPERWLWSHRRWKHS